MPGKTGRPPNTSREEILSVALVLLREGGENGLSIRRLADRLAVAPSSIYNYFAGKNELLESMAEFGVESIPNLSDDDVKPWDKQLADWMSIFRAALLEAPELHMFIALATKSPAIVAILEKIKSIATVLRREGLSEEASVHHAQGIVWTVMSFTYFESMAQDPLIIKGIQNTSGLQEYSDITPYFAVDNYDELWAETVKRNIDGIGVQLRHL